MTLYHGSYTEVAQPLASRGRRNLDFGQGFYLTALQDQAEHWAKVVASRYDYEEAVINVYDFDYEAMAAQGFRLLKFPAYDIDWLDFVVDSRRGGTLWQSYDVIEGGIANDRVIDTVEAYMDGDITPEQAIGKLRYHQPTHQIALLSQSLIDRLLIFRRSYAVSL